MIRQLILDLMLLVVVLSQFGCAPRASSHAIEKWEYKISSLKDEDFASEMNKAGEEGWELVFARRSVQTKTDFETRSDESIPKEERDRLSASMFSSPEATIRASQKQPLYEVIFKRPKATQTR
jgi:hypothetical protein